MRFLKNFFAILTLLFFSVNAYAQYGEVHYTSTSFAVEGRKIAVRGADAMTREQVCERMLHLGAVVQIDIFSQVFLPGVTMKFSREIDGHATAYSVKVTKNAIKIHYTSLEMLEVALSKFYGMFSQVSGHKIVRGGSVLYYADARRPGDDIPNNAQGIFDGVTAKRSLKKVEGAMRIQFAKGDKVFVLAMVNSDIFRVGFKVFDGINPAMGQINDPKSYSFADIQKFKESAKRLGGEFVPAIDLLSDNKQFECYTGHCIYSAEGMRFVRAIIEECANDWGVKSLCVGSLSRCTATNGYVDFLKDIANRNSIKLVM